MKYLLSLLLLGLIGCCLTPPEHTYEDHVWNYCVINDGKQDWYVIFDKSGREVIWILKRLVE